MSKENQLEFSWLVRGHYHHVLEIEKSYPHSWDEDHLVEILRTNSTHGMVATLGGHVVGFWVQQTFKSALYLVRFAVHPHCRQQGIGRRMLDYLKAKLSPRRRSKLVMHVPETDMDMLLFLRKQRFLATKLLREYFDCWEPIEDGILMEFEVEEEAESAAQAA